MAITIKILVAGRNILLLEAIEAMFVDLSAGAMVLTATTLEDAILIAQRVHPELIVIDPWMGSAAAEDVVRQVVECWPASRLFVMATSCDPDLERRMRRAGASGCCEKESMPACARAILDAVTATR